MSISYGEYLKLDELLSLQSPLSDPVEHDEWLFIRVHQVYELWFAQLLCEGELLCQRFKEHESWNAVAILKRILTIMKVLVMQTDVLETMTSSSFKNFRAALEKASGLQSYQFKEVEIFLGWRQKHMNHSLPPPIRERLVQRAAKPSLWDYFCMHVRSYDASFPSPQASDNPQYAHKPNEEAQKRLIRIMKKHTEVTLLAECMTDLDEGFQNWRYRHVKMAERTIGYGKGTGGTSGVDYLKNTVHKQAFPDLWQLRNLITEGFDG